jgi:hypothetical protein
MDGVWKPTNSVCYTPSSEPYRIYLFRKLDLFPSSSEGKKSPIQMVPLERVSITGHPLSDSHSYHLQLPLVFHMSSNRDV